MGVSKASRNLNVVVSLSFLRVGAVPCACTALDECPWDQNVVYAELRLERGLGYGAVLSEFPFACVDKCLKLYIMTYVYASHLSHDL